MKSDRVRIIKRKDVFPMSYKIVRKSDAYAYEAPGHYNMLPTRLHNPEDVNDGKLVVGLSHFLPGGGCQFGNNPMESVYYIISGEMTLTTDDGETVLHEGDTFHCGPGTNKGIQNNGTETCKMLVCLTNPNA